MTNNRILVQFYQIYPVLSGSIIPLAGHQVYFQSGVRLFLEHLNGQLQSFRWRQLNSGDVVTLESVHEYPETKQWSKRDKVSK